MTAKVTGSQYRIEPLGADRLEEAIELTRSLFWYGTDRRWAAADLRHSVAEQQHPRKWYWVAINERGELVGITGLYREPRDRPSLIWLGWFGVHPHHRNRGLGTRLLKFTIEVAIARGYSTMRIYTSTDPNEIQAHRLYERFGFVRDPGRRRGEYLTFSRPLGKKKAGTS